MIGEMKRLGRRVLGGALMLASTAGSGMAEGWQADAVPVSAAEVQAVLDSLDRIEAAVRAAGRSFAGAQGGRLSETVPRVAGEYGLDGGLPDHAVRVLAAYDALRQGVVNTRGGWSPRARAIRGTRPMGLPSAGLAWLVAPRALRSISLARLPSWS